MKNLVIFITKSLCYHQVYLADELYKIYGDCFFFIQCREPLKFRVEVNQEGFIRPYLKGLKKGKAEYKECIKLLKSASVIIKGEVSYSICRKFNKNAIVFYYSERLNKDELEHLSNSGKIKRNFRLRLEKLFPLGRKQVLLSAGAYTPLDYSKYRLFKSNILKWGYFPNIHLYDWQFLRNKKNFNVLRIVWVSRLIKYKHPESAISLAKCLKKNGINFTLKFIGDGDENSGEMKAFLENQIIINDLQNHVFLLGKIPSTEVHKHYEESDIALFTSSSSEGWGVGLNEAMNAGCAVVCSHTVGAARYLIEHKTNGLIYKFGDQAMLNNFVINLSKNIEEREYLQNNAFLTIKNLWNYKIAAYRLSKVIEGYLNNKPIQFNDGPCSVTGILNETDDIWKD